MGSPAAPMKDIKDIEKMKEYLKSKNERDYILFMLGIYTGFNITNILHLRVKDVKGREYVTGGSSSTLRQVYIRPELKKALNHYIRGKSLNDFLIQNQNAKGNEQIGCHQAYWILKRAANELGMKDTPSLRKTFGYFNYKENRDLSALKKLLGQTNLVDTLKFIEWEGDER